MWKIVQYKNDGNVFKTRYGETEIGFKKSLREVKSYGKVYTYKVYIGSVDWEEKKVNENMNNELLNENIKPMKENEPLNESYESFNQFLNEYYQVGDTVRFDKEKAYVIGEIEGKLLVQVQGNTYLVDEKDLKDYRKKVDLTTVPHMKFDEETQKLLFEQYVKCGIYMGNVPVKLNDCFVRYSSWEKAKPEQQIKVLVEGNTTFVTKSQVRIFEDLNSFANPDDYIPGVIIDETNEDALENILINAIDYTNAVGDADAVKIIRKTLAGPQELQTMPKACLRTMAV
jgi:hypothetical protein